MSGLRAMVEMLKVTIFKDESPTGNWASLFPLCVNMAAIRSVTQHNGRWSPDEACDHNSGSSVCWEPAPWWKRCTVLASPLQSLRPYCWLRGLMEFLHHQPREALHNACHSISDTHTAQCNSLWEQLSKAAVFFFFFFNGAPRLGHEIWLCCSLTAVAVATWLVKASSSGGVYTAGWWLETGL